MRVTYPNWKVLYRPNNTEKFGMSGKKISCLIWNSFHYLADFLKNQVQKWNFNSVGVFLNQCENDQEKMVTEGIDNWDVRRG